MTAERTEKHETEAFKVAQIAATLMSGFLATGRVTSTPDAVSDAVALLAEARRQTSGAAHD